MDKLLENVKKELKEVEAQGLNMNNLDVIHKLVSLTKDLEQIKAMKECEKKKEGSDMRHEDYRDDYRDGYREERKGSYERYDEHDDYRRRGMSGRYRDTDRFHEHLDRLVDGAEAYEYNKSRYRHGDEGRIHEGLEKLMYALCMFVESTMDFAESPEEKEIIRKHVHKISKI